MVPRKAARVVTRPENQIVRLQDDDKFFVFSDECTLCNSQNGNQRFCTSTRLWRIIGEGGEVTQRQVLATRKPPRPSFPRDSGSPIATPTPEKKMPPAQYAPGPFRRATGIGDSQAGVVFSIPVLTPLRSITMWVEKTPRVAHFAGEGLSRDGCVHGVTAEKRCAVPTLDLGHCSRAASVFAS
jgi:hypothetical protein